MDSIKGGDDYAVTTQTSAPITITAGNFGAFGSNFFPDPRARTIQLGLVLAALLGAGALVFLLRK